MRSFQLFASVEHIVPLHCLWFCSFFGQFSTKIDEDLKKTIRVGEAQPYRLFTLFSLLRLCNLLAPLSPLTLLTLLMPLTLLTLLTLLTMLTLLTQLHVCLHKMLHC